MKWTSALAIYALFWWLCLFFVLPFHGRRADETASDIVGAEKGAPAVVRFGRIAAQVSIVAALAFALYYLNYVNGWLTAADLGLSPPPRH